MPSKRPTTAAKRATKTVKRPIKTAAKKLDLYAKHKNEYVASKMPTLVRVGPARYLGISGRGKPGSPEMDRAIGALYGVAFTIKMARKAAGQDYTVTKLEGLWWLDEGTSMAASPATTVWNWQLLIRIPTFVSAADVKRTADELVAKGKDEDVRRVGVVELNEGQCVQILHVGPYTEEQADIEKMREFAAKAGRSFDGKHHEIYLSDPRRVVPAQLKTILRQPVR